MAYYEDFDNNTAFIDCMEDEFVQVGGNIRVKARVVTFNYESQFEHQFNSCQNGFL